MDQLLANKRWLNLGAFGVCAGMLAFALYAQHGMLLDPCPLCVFQRVAVAAMGIFFLLAGLQNPGRLGSVIYALLIAAAAAAGAGVAGRHVWLQNLPPDKVPACGPGLDFMLDAFPFTEVLEMVLSGSGECADVSWTLLGLTMPAWVLVAVLTLGSAGLLINLWPSTVRSA